MSSFVSNPIAFLAFFVFVKKKKKKKKITFKMLASTTMASIRQWGVNESDILSSGVLIKKQFQKLLLLLL